MRIIGMDLAVTGAHKAVVMSEQGEYVSPVLSFRTLKPCGDFSFLVTADGGDGCVAKYQIA